MQGDADITIPSDVPTGRREVNKTSTRKKTKTIKLFLFQVLVNKSLESGGTFPIARKS